MRQDFKTTSALVTRWLSENHEGLKVETGDEANVGHKRSVSTKTQMTGKGILVRKTTDLET